MFRVLCVTISPYKLTFSFGWQGTFLNSWLAQILIFICHTDYHERKKSQTCLSLTQIIPPNFWLISLLLPPTLTTWTYFQDGITWEFEIRTNDRKRGSLSCQLFVTYFYPGSWPLTSRSLRLPKTLASGTNLKLCSKAQPGPCGHCSQHRWSRNLLTFYHVLGTKLTRSKNFLSILSSEH